MTCLEVNHRTPKMELPRYMLLLLLLIATTAITGANLARKNELLEKDSRLIRYKDLMSTARRFYDPETGSYSELLFDVARTQIIVGARDKLYRMSFDLELLEEAVWEATPEQIAMCQAKGQSVELCRNYVRVLQSYGENQLYACGTNAFHPSCSRRQMENLTALGFDSGVGKCPFNPRSNITSLMTSIGQIFVGTVTDFMSSDAAILRTNVQPSMPDYNKIIRTKQYNSHWLNSPQFVGSFEAGNFVYFLFREIAVEYINCGKAIYSRIARVCKNDVSGEQFLKDNWTSFLKARLNCSLPGEYPFYYNEVQGMSYDSAEEVLYATFTTADNSIAGSAVCAYNMSAINDAFDGAFKYQEHVGSEWKSVRPPNRSHFQCETPANDSRFKLLLESNRYQLMDEAVQPLTTAPLYHSQLERFKQIALDTVLTKTEKVHVLYIANTQNYIKKLSLKYELVGELGERQAQTCLVEVWQSDDTGYSQTLSMSYLKVEESLYIGTDLALTKIPAQHCARHATQASCMNAMDPYCGWNERIEKCTQQELDLHIYKYWLQPKTLTCPVLNVPIDGGFSVWSEWDRCKKHDEPDANCMCRTRQCNNPAPQNGGRGCVGFTTEVENCTVHGGWTEWSAWSACSNTCGIGLKTRYRSCTNPKPQYGGRMCVGSDHSEMYCTHLPPCPAPILPAVDGGWGPWGKWGECSSACGGGFRIRVRECDDPVPQNGGQECPGCKIDYEECNMHSCPEVKRQSSWTPWLVQYNESEARRSGKQQRIERRYRFVCRATTSDASSVRIAMAKEETRVCHADGNCYRRNTNEETELDGELAAEWTVCSANCGGGVQYRIHEIGKHRGRNAPQSRICNTQPCPASKGENEVTIGFNEVLPSNEWSCWTDWSHCSVSCGVGLRRRTRKCLARSDKLCAGRAIDEERCEMPPCEHFLGWGAWSEWSECSQDGIRFRYRKCIVEQPNELECLGSEYEKTACVPGECRGTPLVATAFTPIISVVVVVSVCAVAFTFWLTKRHYCKPLQQLKHNNAPSTPSYDSYPNQYSSLPTRDIYDVRPKVKRQSSFNMCSPSKNTNAGTLNRNNIHHNHTPKVLAKTYNDYESAGTLKRNSNAMNNNRSNIDDMKF